MTTAPGAAEAQVIGGTVKGVAGLRGAEFGCFFFSSRRRHTRLQGDWSSDVCSSDLGRQGLRRARRRPALYREGSHRPLRREARELHGAEIRAVRRRPAEDRQRQDQTTRSEEHTSELQSPCNLVCRLLLDTKNTSTQR